MCVFSDFGCSSLLHFIVVFAQTPACCQSVVTVFLSDRIYCTHRFPWDTPSHFSVAGLIRCCCLSLA